MDQTFGYISITWEVFSAINSSFKKRRQANQSTSSVLFDAILSRVLVLLMEENRLTS